MSLGFIIVRHVNSPTTNQYWIEAYRCIRKLYPTHWVLIVDDHSIQSFIVFDFALYRCKVIPSEYPQAGELLGYYYFHRTKMFSQAVILHDSVFLHRRLPHVHAPVRFLWHFMNPPEHEREEKQFIGRLRHSKSLLRLYEQKERWVGCFGVQSVITLDFLEFLETKYGLFELVLPFVRTRFDRQCMERVFALLCCMEYSSLAVSPSLFGVIFDYAISWGFAFRDYENKKRSQTTVLPVTKVWTGR